MSDTKMIDIADKKEDALHRLDKIGEQTQKALTDPLVKGNEVLATALAHLIDEMRRLRRDLTEIAEAMAEMTASKQ